MKHILFVIISFKLLFMVLHKVSMQLQVEAGFAERNRNNSLQYAII
jgi:hypothetical protein